MRGEGDCNGKRRPVSQAAFSRLIVQSGREDLNLRPPAPEAGALTGLRYAPNTLVVPTDGTALHGPKGSRTPNLLIRSQMLYPVELWTPFPATRIHGRYKTRTCDLHDVNVAL